MGKLHPRRARRARPKTPIFGYPSLKNAWPKSSLLGSTLKARNWPKTRLDQPGDMTHFAAGTRFALAIEMQIRPGLGQDLGPAVDFGSDQIFHYRPIRH